MLFTIHYFIFIQSVSRKLKCSLQGFRGDYVNTQVLKKDADGLCRLSQAALCLFEEVRESSVIINSVTSTLRLLHGNKTNCPPL